MKKLFAFLLALVMVLSLAACGGNSGQDTSGSAPAQSGSGSSGGSDSAAPAKLTLILRAGTYADVIKECLPAFEAENNVTCEVQELSESDLYSGIALDASEKFVSGLAYVLMTLFALCAILPCLHVISKAFSKGTYVTAGLVNFWP